jgi:Domain of unknown function (DUF4145)
MSDEMSDEISSRRVDGNVELFVGELLGDDWTSAFRPAFGSLPCRKCHRVLPVDLHWKGVRREMQSRTRPAIVTQLVLPGLALFSCRVCGTNHSAMVDGPNPIEDSLWCEITLFGAPPSLVTPATPPGVGYYLEQAAAAKGALARSAAATMFRSALEHLLIDQDYRQERLHDKIEALAADLASNDPKVGEKAKKWAPRVGPKVLHSIRLIGNHAVHANDGDIEKQKLLDEDTLDLIEVVFLRLLRAVYDDPAADQKTDEDLEKAAEQTRKRKEQPTS